MARFAIYPNTVQIRQLPPRPLGGQEFALAAPKGGEDGKERSEE